MKGLVLTYLVTAGSAVGALRYPRLGLYVYVAYAVLRPQAIFGWAGDLDNMSLIVGVAMLIGWAIHGFGTWKWGRARPIVFSFLAFVLWFALSATFAVDPVRAFGYLWIFARLVLPFFVAVTILNDGSSAQSLLWTIVLCQGYVGFENNLSYVVKGYNTAALGFGGMDNNCFGVSLVCVLGPAIALTLASKGWFKRGLAAVAGLLILHTALLTFSRGTMIGLLVVAFTAVVLLPKRPRYLLPLAAAVLLAVRLTGPQLAARYSTAFSADGTRDGSAESRLDLWADCLQVVESQPFLGVGPANWPVVASRFGWPEGKSAHSVWMETAAEVGVPGVLALMAFFGWTVVRLWPIARANLTDDNRIDLAIASGVILGVVGFVIAGQFVSVATLEVPYYVVAVGAALLKSVPAAIVPAEVQVTGSLRQVPVPRKRNGMAGPIASRSA